MNRKTRYLWILAAGLSPLLVLLALLTSTQFWLNQAAVKGEVEALLARATGGRAQYERVDLHWLPLPRAELTALRFSLPGIVEAEAKSAAVELGLLALLRGKIVPHRVHLASPQIRIQLDEPSASPFSLKDFEAGVRAALAQIQASAPGVNAQVSTGQVELRVGRRPPLLLKNLDLDFDVAGNTVTAKVSGGSDLWTRFNADLRLDSDTLNGGGQAALTGLDLSRIAPALGITEGWPIQAGSVNANLKLTLRGFTDAQAEASISAPKVAVQYGKAQLALAGLAVEATATSKGEAVTLKLGKAALDSPRIAMTASLEKSAAGGYALTGAADEVDLPGLQAFAKSLAPAVPALANLPVDVTRGTLTSVNFNARAGRLEDLFALPALQASGAVSKVDLSLPILHHIKIREAGAQASIEQGVVRIRQAQARLDKSSVRDGSFELDLTKRALPLRGDATVSADLAEGHALAKRILTDPQLQQQLNQVQELAGNAQMRVTVGGNIKHVTVGVQGSSLAGSGRHALLPFPIQVTRSSFAYSGAALTVQGLDGSVGQSSFTGVSVRLGLNPPSTVTADQGSANAALAEIFSWAAKDPRLAKQLDGVQQVSGTLGLSLTQLELPLDTPAQMRFQIAATPRLVGIDAPKYAPPLKLDGGVIALSEQSVDAKGVNATLLDAALEVSGHTDNYRKGIDNLQAGASGTIGLNALAWIYARAGLPQELRLRGALNLANASVGWRAAGEMSARGNAVVAGGPKIGFNLRSLPGRYEMEQLTLQDDVSNATASGSLAGNHFNVAYKGRLAGSSVDRIFVEPIAAVEQLQGDFTATGDLRRPDATTATGSLQGTQIRLPPLFPVPLLIETLSLEAKNTVLQVKSATVSSGENRVAASGSVSFTKDKFVVDADVRSDKIVIPVVPEPAGTKSAAVKASPSDSLLRNAEKQRELLHALWAIPTAGTVRVNIGEVRYGSVQVAPLVGSATLAATQVDLRITRAALCAIAMSGGLSMTKDGLQATLKLGARGAQLDKSVDCLTNQRLKISGTVDLDGDFSARGALGRLWENVHGSFSVVASNGRIDKFDALADVFSLINVTQLVSGKLPDLRQSGMAYSSIQAKGRIAGTEIHLSEAMLDAAGFKAAAHGEVDLATGAMRFDGLFAPFQTMNWVSDHIPIVRRVLGGTIFAVPVRIGGTLEKPQIIPISFGAAGSRLLDVLGNTLTLPGELVSDTQGAQPQAAPDQR